jgi:branched-chain amino acid transport system ATP-binding protein
MVGRMYGSSPAKTQGQAREECVRILSFVGLAGKQDALARNLTFVDRKRLELARALATRPQLLLLDELMSGLNPTETESTMQLIRAIRDSGVTIVMVEHIIKAVLGLCDRVVVLNAGEKIAEGSPEEIVSNQRVIEAYLGKTTRA